MSNKKKPLINDARKELSNALKKFLDLEADFNNNFPHKPIKFDTGNFSFYATDVETQVNEWDNVEITFIMENGLKLRIEINKTNVIDLEDFLTMDLYELNNRENTNEENEEENNDWDETLTDGLDDEETQN